MALGRFPFQKIKCMALILNLESSTRNCSVVLSQDEKILACRESGAGNDHAAKMTVFVQEVLEEAGKQVEELDAVAVGEGPGSYTGLRIGVATAKGLAYGIGKPLLAVSPLQAMAWEARRRAEVEGLSSPEAIFCAMTDAGRMEVYSALYDTRCRELRKVEAEIIQEGSFAGYGLERPFFFAGDACAKCRPVLQLPRMYFYEDIRPSARYMPSLSAHRFAEGKFVDVAYFEPFYLKDFIAGKPHVKGLD